MAGVRTALPTCYDQWFPELARIYGLKGAQLIIYPTAIGSEPSAPDFDSQPLWQKVIVANGIMNNTFMVAVNRIGTEDGVTFYGSSFISDPLGNVLAQAPRGEPAVLVADLDMGLRERWGELFPFFRQRQPQHLRLAHTVRISWRKRCLTDGTWSRFLDMRPMTVIDMPAELKEPHVQLALDWGYAKLERNLIDNEFDAEFANQLAEHESYNKHLYRPTNVVRCLGTCLAVI